MPELRNQAGAGLARAIGGLSKAILVLGLIAGDDRPVRKGGRIDGYDLSDDHASAALRPFDEEVDPALRHPVTGTVVGEGRR